MNKNIITGLIILMSISLVGIIMVQAVWINNAIKERELQFSRNVNDALENIATKIEKKDNLHIINRIIGNESINNLIKNKNKNKNKIVKKQNINVKNELICVVTDKNKNIVKFNNFETHTEKLEKMRNNLENISMCINDKEIIFDIETSSQIFSTVSMKKTEIEQDLRFAYSFTTNPEITNFIKINDSISRRLNKITKIKNNFEKKTEKLEKFTQKLIIELKNKENISIEKRISGLKIHNLLKQELENKGINSKFSWEIIENNLSEKKYKVQLFPNDILPETNFLVVNIFNENEHIYKSMILMLSGSGILTLFIILTFGVTIYTIIKQKKTSEIKSDFINNMTHEFKTPIATISLAADSIINPKVINNKERIKRFTKVIKEENKRMNKQVETILQIAAFDKKDFIMSSQAVDVHGLIFASVNEIILQAEQKGGSIIFKADAKKSVIYTDAVQFKNVVRNLLDNAIKYSKEKPEISVNTTNINDNVVISVKDSGIGMSRETRKKIFEKFYRKTSGNVHNVKGFGLGLNYVKAIVDACKGKVEVSSELGKGSTFNLMFPVV